MASTLQTPYGNEFTRRVTQRWLEGKAEGRAEGLLALLGLLGLEVSGAERARILRTTDFATLDRWFDRAATAPSTAAVLGRHRPIPRLAPPRPHGRRPRR